MNLRRLLTLVIVLTLLGAAAYAFVGESVPREAQPFEGYRAPDLEGIDLATGQTVRLSDFRGQVVFLNFWASWCPPCRWEMPDIQRIYEEMGDKVKVIAFAADGTETPEELQAYIKELGLTFTVARDGTSEMANRYLVRALPTSLFIDRKGVIRVRVEGAIDYDTMVEFIDKASK